jgi:Ca-activated chloride channel family protein
MSHRCSRLAALLGVVVGVGCGSSGSQDTPPPSVAPTIPDAPRPAPGADLDGPIPLPDPLAAAPRGTAAAVDMMTDRAIVMVSVPTPPLGAALAFTFADDRRAWVTQIPDSVQLPSVAFAHDQIYVSGGFESVSFYSLDAKTGKVNWATTNLEDNGPTAAVVEDDDVLFNTESCTLFSLDARTGKRNWHRFLGDPTLSQIAVVDGLVYASHPGEYGPGEQFLSAYRVKTGAPVWTREIGTELLATPVVSGDSVYVSTVEGYTFRFDHRTGKQRWKRALHATTAPWIAGDELFVGRRIRGKEQQIVVATETGKILREHTTSAGAYASDVPTSIADWKTVWAFEGSRPVVDHGIRYVAMGNEVHASDASSGETLWTRRYPGSADKRSLGSVALAGSALVVSSRDGKIYGFDVDTGFTLWSYDLGQRITAEPIIAKGWLYATTTTGLVIALEVADPALDGWHMFGGNAQKNGPTLPPGAPPPLEGPRTATTAAAPMPQAAVPAAKPAPTPEEISAAIAHEAELARKQDAARALEEARKKAAHNERLKGYAIPDACKNNPLC